MKRICTLISIALVALVGCGGSDSVSSDHEATAEYASRSVASAIGHNWVLKSFVSGDEIVDVIQGSETTLKFDTDGHVVGTTGCNHYGGSYTEVDSSNLSIGALAATEMACMGDGIMDQESRFLRSLTSVSSMELRDEELRLYLERASDYLLFVAAADDPSQNGTAHPDSAITDSTVCEPPDTPEPLPADLRLTSTDSGDTIELDRPGAIVEIALESNPSTGYSWQIIDSDSTTLMLVRELFEPGDEEMPGAPGIQRLFFEARAPGTTHLKLGYMRVWESLPPLQIFDIGFIVNGGIVPPPIPLLGIRIGTSFGECLGYCWKEVILDEEAIVVIARGWDAEAYPEKVYEEKMKPELWAQLQTTADFSTLEQMDEVYGCPDCADGGAEWVTMTLSGRIETVKFEYGAKLEPLAGLLELLRAVREDVIERSGL